MVKALLSFEGTDISTNSDFGNKHSPPRPAVTLYPGERALMIAVLEDAIRCYLGLVHYDRTNPEILARQAEYWMRLEDWESPFSFNNICESLGLQHGDTRATILAWRDVDPEQLEARIRSLHTEASANGKAA